MGEHNTGGTREESEQWLNSDSVFSRISKVLCPTSEASSADRGEIMPVSDGATIMVWSWDEKEWVSAILQQ